MRKFLVVLLALALVFAFAACGEQAAPAEEPVAGEGITVIPMGGELPDADVSAYGTYTQIEPPADLTPEEGDQFTVYYDEQSITPYIFVTRWAKDGATLEEEAAACAETYGAVSYQMTDWNGVPCAYYCTSAQIDGAYYFADCWIREDGDDFVEIAYLGASEELQLGESNTYLWVPAGYQDMMNEEEQMFGTVFAGSYDTALEFPNIWIGKYEPGYEWLQGYWVGEYPDGNLPVDEATYTELMAKEEWTDEDNEAYYGAFGYTNIASVSGQSGDTAYEVFLGDWEDYHVTETYFAVGEDGYILYTDSQADPDPRFAKALIDSLHTK